jgi:hypothetical protein
MQVLQAECWFFKNKKFTLSFAKVLTTTEANQWDHFSSDGN